MTDDYKPLSNAEWLAKEMFAARAERDALRAELAAERGAYFRFSAQTIDLRDELDDLRAQLDALRSFVTGLRDQLERAEWHTYAERRFWSASSEGVEIAKSLRHTIIKIDRKTF